MKRKLALVAVAAAMIGALAVSLPSHALTMFADLTQWIDAPAGNGTQTTSNTNPLPSGIYPAWGADVAVTCNVNSTVSSQLAAGRYVVNCGVVAFGDQGASTVSATTSERRIPANYTYPVRVDDTTTDGYIALLCTASTTCIISADG